MRRRMSAVPALLLLVALPACEPAPDEAAWQQLAARDSAEEQAEMLERNSGPLDFDALCERCRITAEHVATLGAATDPMSFSMSTEVAADSAATRFYVATSTLRGQIAVYGKDGQLIRTIGQPGEGPGEFGGQLLLEVGPGDSLHVVQSRPGRYSVWTPEGELARSFPLAHRFTDFALLPSGDLVLNAPEPSPRGQVFRLVQLSPTGEPVRVFDATTDGDEGTYYRRLGVAQDWLWATTVARYELDAFDAGGYPRVHREADPEWEAPAGFRPGLRPEPGSLIPGQAAGITGEDRRRVFVLTALPPEGARVGETEGPPYVRTLVQYVFDGLDQVYAATILEGLVRPMSRGLAYRVNATPDGDTRVEILRLRQRR